MIIANPLLEPLPSLTGVNAIFNALASDPPDRSPEFWAASVDARIDHLQSLNGVYVPGEQGREHFDKLSSVLRAGLARRNPNDPKTMRLIHAAGIAVTQRRQGLSKKRIAFLLPAFEASGLFLDGPTGVGKTMLINRFRASLPVYNEISELAAGKCSIQQVFLVHVSCPSNGTVVGLMVSILFEIDQIVGSSYADTAVQKRLPRDICEAYLISCLWKHFVGIVFVDDIQHLLKHPHLSDILLQTLCTLMERSRVPIVTAGTYAAEQVIDTKSALGAKLTGEAHLKLKAWVQGIDWTRLNKTFWHQRVSQGTLNMPIWLPEESHFHTCGILRLYRILMKTFLRGLATGAISDVTPDSFATCAKDSLGPYQKSLSVLRRHEAGDELTDEEKKEYEDWLPPDDDYVSPKIEKAVLKEIASRRKR
ncbi:Transposon Tn7 transposition protein TnsC [Caballeronia hypogeia]|uniref:Transposon Tn7 transposition protein TnsC n=1 Tax=Caballeronia hypogeia TaxID=1777140 RepID=A0A158ACD8_9BURK|nr:ATP-binding protein [Caballeronia hypogeia]SAK55522.1 Transposon Tn7 transposition protein TnsC [Caballeronia hypogeia]